MIQSGILGVNLGQGCTIGGEILAMTAVMPTNKGKVGVYVDMEVKRDLEALAASESRSVSNFVELLIKDAVSKAKAEGKI
jgi:hypothetical protein